jgi:hypothetical protein
MKQKLNCVLIIDDDEPTNYFNRIIRDCRICEQTIDKGKIKRDIK